MIDVSKLDQRQLRMSVGHLYDKWEVAEKILAALKEGGATLRSIDEAEKRVQECKQDYEAVRNAIK